MSEQHIQIRQLFNAPVDTIFDILTDHASFGQVINANIKRVVDSPGDNQNGVGSVRRINAFPAPAFEETVVTFEPNQLMEYVISKGSPIKKHMGRMEFSEEHDQTRLEYAIIFEPKLPFLLLGSIIKNAIEKSIREGLQGLAKRYEIQ